MGSKEAEIELLINFAVIIFSILTGVHHHLKPLRLILTRQLDKINKAIAQLHEDLQFDYSSGF